MYGIAVRFGCLIPQLLAGDVRFHLLNGKARPQLATGHLNPIVLHNLVFAPRRPYAGRQTSQDTPPPKSGFIHSS